jgi:hypothetical protein
MDKAKATDSFYVSLDLIDSFIHSFGSAPTELYLESESLYE